MVAIYRTTPSPLDLKTSDLAPRSQAGGRETPRRRKRHPEARCEWTAFGGAALPELCGARTSLPCTPPRDRLPEAAEGARFLSAKVLLLFFVQRTLFIGGRPGVSLGGCGARSPPRLPGLTLHGQPAHLGAPWAWLPPPEHLKHKSLQEVTQPLPGHAGTRGKRGFHSGSEPQLLTYPGDLCACRPGSQVVTGHSFFAALVASSPSFGSLGSGPGDLARD